MKTAGEYCQGRYTGRALGLFCVLLLIATQPLRLNAQEKSFLWKVSRGENNIYLLGSIHYLGKEHFPLRRAILEALDRSKKLVLEIDLNSLSPERTQRATLEQALYRDGTTLEQNIDPEVYRAVEKRAAQLGFNIKVLSPMKPWFAALTMTALKMRQLGLDPNLGVDRQLAERARLNGTPTRGLETFEFQIGLMDRLDKREQENMLRETVADLDRIDQDIDRIVQAWLGGDGDGLENLLLVGKKMYPDLYTKLIVERNRRWLSEIEMLIHEGGGAMVVVGAAHLVGREGILEMLKGRGYNLEQQ